MNLKHLSKQNYAPKQNDNLMTSKKLFFF